MSRTSRQFLGGQAQSADRWLTSSVTPFSQSVLSIISEWLQVRANIPVPPRANWGTSWKPGFLTCFGTWQNAWHVTDLQ